VRQTTLPAVASPRPIASATVPRTRSDRKLASAAASLVSNVTGHLFAQMGEASLHVILDVGDPVIDLTDVAQNGHDGRRAAV
jgi:hypothetical protein